MRDGSGISIEGDVPGAICSDTALNGEIAGVNINVDQSISAQRLQATTGDYETICFLNDDIARRAVGGHQCADGRVNVSVVDRSNARRCGQSQNSGGLKVDSLFAGGSCISIRQRIGDRSCQCGHGDVSAGT